MPFVPLQTGSQSETPNQGFTPIATPLEYETSPIVERAKYVGGVVPGIAETAVGGAIDFAGNIGAGVGGMIYGAAPAIWKGQKINWSDPNNPFYKEYSKEQSLWNKNISPVLAPQTEAGKDIMGGFTNIAAKMKSLGEKVTDITGSEAAGAWTEAALQTVGIPLGAKALGVIPLAGSGIAAALAKSKGTPEGVPAASVADQLKAIRPEAFQKAPETPTAPPPEAEGKGFTPEPSPAPAPVSPEPEAQPTPEQSAQMAKDAEAYRKLQEETKTPDQPSPVPPDAAGFTTKPGDVPSASRHAVPGVSIQEVPLANLKLSEDVPQFKKEANEKGIVSPLGGKFDRVGVAPIQIWQRLNGDLEIISGRHRFDLAQRSGETTIPAQIHREADGFDRNKATTLDAELNIRDEQGGVNDYANYFKNSGITEKEANSRGLLARAKGKAGWTIGRFASPDVFAAHGAGVISDEAALAFSRAAPKDAAAQAVGLKMVNEGRSVNQAENTIRAIAMMEKNGEAKPEQGDIFGFDDSAIRQAEEMAKRASSAQHAIREQIAAVSGATKRPEVARKMGVDVKDPEAVKGKITELRGMLDRLQNWPLYPDLVRAFKGEDERPPMELKGETEAEIKAKEAAKAKTDAEARAKETAPPPEEFKMTGSDREADVAAAHGQGDLLASERRNLPDRSAMYDLAKNLAMKDGKIGISKLRRHYPQLNQMQAARILEQLETDGVVGPIDINTGSRTLQGEPIEKAAEAKPREEKQPQTAAISIGRTPNSAEPVTVRDGKIFIGEYPAQDYETGEDVAIANDATPQQIKDALDKAGAIGKGQKVFGLKEHVEKEPALPEAKPVSDTVKRILAERERAKGGQVKQEVAAYGETPTFFSQLSKSIVSAPDKIFGNAQSVSDWLNANAGKLGVKKAEIEATGLDDWLKLQGKVSKADVMNYLDQNGVQVEDVVLDSKKAKPTDNPYETGVETRWGNDPRLQLPGGENYKELLLTLPVKETGLRAELTANELPDGSFQVMRGDRFVGNQVRAIDAQDAIDKALTRHFKETPPGFKSTHFDQPNILAHVRFNERVDAEGNKVLFLEELQSDWGQKGKKIGFKTGAEIPVTNFSKWFKEQPEYYSPEQSQKLFQMGQDGLSETKHDGSLTVWGRWKKFNNDEINRATIESRGMPSAPFVTDTKAWTALSLKRMIRWAIDNGSDGNAAWQDITKPQSVREQVDQHLGGELASVIPLKVMDVPVLLASKNNQVRAAIVKAIPVDVMDILTKNGIAPESLLRKSDVFGKFVPIPDRATVARGLADALQLVGTRLRTALDGVLSSKSGWGDKEVLPAVRAGDLDPGVVVGLLSPVRVYGSDWNMPLTRLGGAKSGAELPITGRDNAGVGRKYSSTELARLLNRHDVLSGGSPSDSISKYEPDSQFTKIAWASGTQQAARYDLSKQVDSVQWALYSDDKVDIYMKPLEMGAEHEKVGRYKLSELDGVVGKELANKIIEQHAAGEKNGEFSGLDLKVGGEGMKGYYDQIVPQVANDILKKLGGGKVEQVDIGIDNQAIRHPETGDIEDVIPAHLENQQGFTITPAMRESASSGMPLFQQRAQYDMFPETTERQEEVGKQEFYNPKSPEYTNPYDSLETRPNTNKEQLDAGREALADVEKRIFGRNRSGVLESASVLGSNISKGFREKGHVSLIGQKVSSAGDLALISQVLRDQRFETFRGYFVKDGVIVGERAYSSRMSSSVSLPGDIAEHISADMGRTGADGYWLQHNHPKGEAAASDADIRLTEMIAGQAKGMLGHVIIDHNEYNAITLKDGLYGPEAVENVVKADFGAEKPSPEVPHELIGKKIGGPKDMVDIAKRLQQEGIYSSIIGRNGNGEVSMILDVPSLSESKIPNSLRVAAMIRKAARETGSGEVFAVVPGELKNYTHIMGSGLFRDVISSDGKSASESGQMMSSSIEPTKAQGRGMLKYVAEPEKSYESLSPQGKSIVDRLKSVVGIVKPAVDFWARAPQINAASRIVGKYTGDIQRYSFKLSKVARQINNEFSKLDQRAMSRWMEAGGDEAKIREWANNAKTPELKAVYEQALKLSPKAIETAKAGRVIFDDGWKEAVADGILKDDAWLNNYFAHIGIEKPNAITKKFQAQINAGVLRKNPSFAKQRFFETLFDLEKAGYRQKAGADTFGMGLTSWMQSLEEAKAARLALRSMMDAKMPDGRPMVYVGGVGEAIPKTDAQMDLPGMKDQRQTILVKPNMTKEEAYDYQEFNHPAMRNWKWIGKDTQDNPIMMQGQMRIHPQAVSRIKSLIGKSWFKTYALPEDIPYIGGKRPFVGAQKAGSFVKGTLLSLSPFHQVHLGEHAVFHGVNPFNLPELNLEDPVISQLVDHGLMLYNHNALAEYSEGLHSTGGLFQWLGNKIKTAGEGTAAEGITKHADFLQQYGEYLFQDYIPRLKSAMALKALGRAEKWYAKDLKSGKLSHDQLLDNIAKQSNAGFGELNYRYMGRNQTFQDGLRFALLAPDFLEARMRFSGQALRPYGREQQMAFIKGAVIMGLTAQTINTLVGDNKKPDWTKPFTVTVNGRDYTPRSVMGDVWHMVSDLRSFAYSRLNPLYTRPAVEIGTGRDQRGREETVPDAVKNIASSWVPIPMQGAVKPDDQTKTAAFINSIMQSVGVSNYPAKTNIDKAVGLLFDTEKEHRMEINRVKDDVKALIKTGKTDEAIAKMREANMTPFEIRAMLKYTLAPGARLSPRAMRDFMMIAPDDAKQQMQDLRNQP